MPDNNANHAGLEPLREPRQHFSISLYLIPASKDLTYG